jgi:hypothetical protein
MYYQVISQCTQSLKNLEACLDKAEQHAAAKKFEYQIKNLAEQHERIVRESQLRPNPWHRSGRPAGYRQ